MELGDCHNAARLVFARPKPSQIAASERVYVSFSPSPDTTCPGEESGGNSHRIAETRSCLEDAMSSSLKSSRVGGISHDVDLTDG